MNNILITGGAGFIGSEAVRTLIEKGYNVFNLDKLTYASSEESLNEISNDNYTFFYGDISNKNDVKKFIKESNPNYIINFAAESHVDRSIDGPETFINTNIIGTYFLVNEALSYYSSLSQKEKDNFKFVHVSTDEVYGSLKHNDDLFYENSPYKPNNPYSASKASSDLLVRSWHKTYGLPINITHSSNNYGPWQYPEKLIPLTVKNALKGAPIEIYGDGSNIRDWIFVKDHIEAILSVVFKGKNGETYNIGGNNEVSNFDMVKKICYLLDKLEPLNNGNYSDLIDFVPDRPGHDIRYAISNNKISKDLSWKPKTGINEGLKITIKWMLDNREWLFNKSKDLKRQGIKKN